MRRCCGVLTDKLAVGLLDNPRVDEDQGLILGCAVRRA
jgi:hypothetical protein